MKFLRLFFLYVFGASCLSTIAQQASPDPEDYFASVNARGDQGISESGPETSDVFGPGHLCSRARLTTLQPERVIRREWTKRKRPLKFLFFILNVCQTEILKIKQEADEE
jgi:hypothetical protein